MTQQQLFRDTKPLKLFWLVSIPGAIGMLFSALYQFVDGVFVGQQLGELNFAAINLALPFVIVNFALSDLIAVGSSVPISILHGKKEYQKANNIFTCSCILIVVCAIITGTILYTLAPYLMNLMGADGELEHLATMYLRVYALFGPVTTITFATDNYLKICGKIKYSMMLNILLPILSIILEFIFLFLLRLPIWSAALASCTGMVVCSFLAMIRFIGNKQLLKFTKPNFNKHMLKEIGSCGFPIFMNNIAGRITSITFNTILLSIGGSRAVSVYGVLMFVDGFIWPILYGICDSVQPAVGYNYGQGNFTRVKTLEKYAYFAGAIISLVFAIIIFVIPKPLSLLFVKDADSDFLNISTIALRIFCFSYLIRWFGNVTQSYMLAIEKVKKSLLISICQSLILPLLFIVCLLPLELTGIWLNFPLTSLFTAIISLFVLKSEKKKEHILN